MMKFVAFLRGINLGKRRIKMDDLRAAFDAMGLNNAQTLIASGNVLFEADDGADLVKRIETGLQKSFGFEVPTILRSLEQLTDLAKPDPFAGYDDGPDLKRYVYFLAQPETHLIAAPHEVAGDYKIVKLTDLEIFVVGYRQPNGRFSEGLDVIAKPFKARITNRNWNTIERMIEKAG